MNGWSSLRAPTQSLTGIFIGHTPIFAPGVRTLRLSSDVRCASATKE